MRFGSRAYGELEGFGSMNKVPTGIFPVSFVCLALNDQVFIHSLNKSSAGTFAQDGLVSQREVYRLCVFVKTRPPGLLCSLSRVLGCDLSFGLCLLLQRNRMEQFLRLCFAWEVFRASKRRKSGTVNRSLLAAPWAQDCHSGLRRQPPAVL